MAITTDSVLTALKNGSYTLTSLDDDNFFKTKQPEKRRRYPSIELLETPLGNTATQEKLDFIRGFEVRIFLALRGGVTTGQQDEITNLEVLEQEILAVLETTTLGEHKITVEDKKWKRDYHNEELRPYIMSVLTITVRQVSGISDTPDGVLVFDKDNSEGDSLPSANYTYTQTFNTDISDGYNHIEEFSNANANPKDYTGGFRGSMITHIKVRSADLGSTTDKLNQIRLPQSNGELPAITFIYTNKSSATPSTETIQETLLVNVERVDRIYRVNDNTVFRLSCRIQQPSIIT